MLTEPEENTVPDEIPEENPVEPHPDTGRLIGVVREIEAHAAETGWDQGSHLFALVPTGELARSEPALAEALGLDPTSAGLTPVDQELPADQELEATLAAIVWPEEVAGCAAVLERVVLPPSAEDEIPDDRAAAAAYAAEHPERQELRMVAAVTRTGATYCALRFRSHDDPAAVVAGPDLVPALLQLLQSTLSPELHEENP